MIGVLGGAFKPPHKGHYALVKETFDYDIDELRIYISEKERDGITLKQALKIWDIYLKELKKSFNKPIHIIPHPSPIRAIYKVAENNPTKTILWFLGRRNEEDDKDVAQRVSSIQKYDNIEYDVLSTSVETSGTELRNLLKIDDKEGIFDLLPPIEQKDKEQVYDILKRSIKENLTEVGEATQEPYKWTVKKSYWEPPLMEIIYNFTTDKGIKYQALFYETADYRFDFLFYPEDGNALDIVNKGELFRVMSTIVDIMKDFVKKEKWSVIEYSSVKQHDGDERREKLYTAYLKKNLPDGIEVDERGGGSIMLINLNLKEADPKKGTGKKPKGSGRRLYTDENPKDTVGIKFSTRQDIVDTLNKTSFKNKSHARQSQIINLIHQRVRAAYGRAKDPDVKKRLKSGLDYITKRKEASKAKTQRLKKQKNENVAPNHDGKAAPFGSGYNTVNETVLSKIDELTKHMLDKGYNIEPLPKLELIDDDTQNAADFFGKTAYYDPNTQTIVLYTCGRHPKDIVRSYAHEMVHHIQNLEGRLGGITTTNTTEDSNLENIEKEAYLNGNITFRNWTDSLNEIGDASQKPYKWTKSESSRFPGTINYSFITDKDTEYRAYFVPSKAGFYEFGYNVGDGDPSQTINKGELFRVMSTIVDIMKDFVTTTPWDRIEFEGSKDFERVEKGIEDKRRDKLYRAYLKKHISNFPNIDIFVQGGVTYLYNEGENSLTEYDNSGPSTPKVYIVKDDGTYKEAPIELLSKISNLTYDMGGGETNYYPEKNIVIVDNIPVETFAKEPGEIKGEKVYVEYNLNNPTSLPKADKIIASQLVYHLDNSEVFAQTVANSLKDGGTFEFQSDLMNKKDKTFLQHLSDEYGFGLPTKLNQYKQQPLPLKKGEFVEPVISYTYEITDKDGKTSTLSITKKGNSWEWKKIEGDIDFKTGEWSKPPEDLDPDFKDKKYTLRAFDKYLEYYGDSNTIVDFERLTEDGQKVSDKNMDDYKKSNNPSGKVKDPFGLNAYARELALGLEEEILNEGRYDKFTNQLSKIAFEAIKDGYNVGRKVLDLTFTVGPDDEDIVSNDFDFDFNIKVEYTDDEYKVDGGANAGFDDEGEEIIPLLTVNFKIPKEIDWQTVSFDLKDVVRHELEHLTQDGENIKPGKQMSDDQLIRKMIDSDMLSKADYFKLEKEVDAMLQGLYFKAKKSKRPYIEVIDDYLDKQPISQQQREDILDLWRNRTKALSLPLFENEEKVKTNYTIYSDMDGVLSDFDKRFMEFSDGKLPSQYEKEFGREKFWELIDGKVGVPFWAGMSWMPDGKTLWSYIEKYNPIILSAPSRNQESRYGKRIWKKRNMPSTKMILAYADKKKEYADSTSILIDDREENIKQWNEAGGIGILHTSASNTIAQLKKLGL